jgi:ABC-type nitrate/sulfonate/bicarbonate transport system permease component
MSVQTQDSGVIGMTERSELDDRQRAKKVAAARRRRQLLLNIAVRIVSLGTVMIIWQLFGAKVDQTLFTTPSKIALAAVDMIESGELWTYLSSSRWPL